MYSICKESKTTHSEKCYLQFSFNLAFKLSLALPIYCSIDVLNQPYCIVLQQYIVKSLLTNTTIHLAIVNAEIQLYAGRVVMGTSTNGNLYTMSST